MKTTIPAETEVDYVPVVCEPTEWPFGLLQTDPQLEEFFKPNIRGEFLDTKSVKC
jgi:hypothetical protein